MNKLLLVVGNGLSIDAFQCFDLGLDPSHPFLFGVSDPLIEINPETAAELGITEGDEVYIESPRFEERVYMKARFSPEIHPRVVTCLSHWWFPEKPGPEHGCFESNINTIISTDPPYDPIGMNYQVRAVLCRVGKSTSRATE